jgi:hypothetical protein
MKKIHLPKTEKRFSANVYLLIVKVIGGKAGHSSRANAGTVGSNFTQGMDV